jgi:hypothetical protein
MNEKAEERNARNNIIASTSQSYHDVTIITRLEQQHVVILPLAAYIEMCRAIGVKLDSPTQAVL